MTQKTPLMVTIPDSMTTPLTDVIDERTRQDAKWGEQNHSPVEWLSVLTEEVGEAAQAANNCNWHPTADWFQQLRFELIQVAAVAVAAVESLDRNELAGKR